MSLVSEIVREIIAEVFNQQQHKPKERKVGFV